MICNTCQRELTNKEINITEDNHLYCMECLSFPFKQLNNNELNYEVNPQYNLENLILKNSNNPFWLHNIKTMEYIQISTLTRVWTERRVGHGLPHGLRLPCGLPYGLPVVKKN